MTACDVIAKKRDGGELTEDEILFMIEGCTAGTIPDYQLSAWLMAVYLRGMSCEETASLTSAMLHSGKVLDLSDIAAATADKHSTGGVGDKISIPLAPIAAACGVVVPMMSGRALGHTGGTLDKLDAIKGYKTQLTEGEFRSVLRSCGYAMTGQTAEVAPADKTLYALRDVTATVESIPLITASIMSKKAAEGTAALIFDVKCGKGAFMKTLKDAEQLALSLVKTGRAFGKSCAALITAMDEPLGRATGNFLEIEESMDILEGKGPADTTFLTIELAARMCFLAGKAANVDEGRAMAKRAVESGRAMELFLKNAEAQGAEVAALLADRGKRRSPWKAEIRAGQDGYIAGIAALEVGRAGVALGIGRTRADEPVCPDAGVLFFEKKGAKVKKGSLLMEAYGKSGEAVSEGAAILESAVRYSFDEVARDESAIIKEINELRH